MSTSHRFPSHWCAMCTCILCDSCGAPPPFFHAHFATGKAPKHTCFSRLRRLATHHECSRVMKFSVFAFHLAICIYSNWATSYRHMQRRAWTSALSWSLGTMPDSFQCFPTISPRCDKCVWSPSKYFATRNTYRWCFVPFRTYICLRWDWYRTKLRHLYCFTVFFVRLLLLQFCHACFICADCKVFWLFHICCWIGEISPGIVDSEPLPIWSTFDGPKLARGFLSLSCMTYIGFKFGFVWSNFRCELEFLFGSVGGTEITVWEVWLILTRVPVRCTEIDCRFGIHSMRQSYMAVSDVLQTLSDSK